MRSPASTDRLGWRPSGNGDAKVARQVGGARAVLSEAEFLARRESVARKMIIRQRDDLAQIAVLEDDILVEHYVDRATHGSLIGNVYLGRVQNVLPSMEAAFVDIGRGRNGVIYAGEIDWDYFGAEGQNRKVEKVLKSGADDLGPGHQGSGRRKGCAADQPRLDSRPLYRLCTGRPSLRNLSEAARKRTPAAQGDLVGPGRRIRQRDRPHGCRRSKRRRAGTRCQPAEGAVGGHRAEGRHRQRAATALRRARPHRTHCPRPSPKTSQN